MALSEGLEVEQEARRARSKSNILAIVDHKE